MTNICSKCQSEVPRLVGAIDFRGNNFAWTCEPCHRIIAQQLKDLAIRYGANYSDNGTMLTGPKGTPIIHNAPELQQIVYPDILLIKTHSSVEYADHDCDWAVIEISGYLRHRLAERHLQFEQAKAINGELWRMESFDFAASFISDSEALGQMNPNNADILRFNSFDWLTKEGDLPLTSYLQAYEQAVEASSLVIQQDGFYWTSTPKHCDFDIQTQQIDWDALDRFLGEN